MEEMGKKQDGGIFGGDSAGELVKELRKSFGSGKTRSYEWRAAQLKAIARMICERENDIVDALYSDLSKPRMESFVQEVF